MEQKMILISEEIYNKMLKSYDEAIEELEKTKEMLEEVKMRKENTVWKR